MDHVLIPEAERKRVKSWRWVFPPPYHHYSNHRTIVLRIWGRWGLKRYVRERETLPVQPPAVRKRPEGEEMFGSLAVAIKKPQKREWKKKSWIRPGTWASIDKCGSNDKAGILKRYSWIASQFDMGTTS